MDLKAWMGRRHHPTPDGVMIGAVSRGSTRVTPSKAIIAPIAAAIG
jgi:hypothetical protein